VAEPAVALSFRTDGAGPEVQSRITRNVVAIISRPTFTPASLEIIRVAPHVPAPPPRREPVVRRARPSGTRNTIRARFLADSTRELYERLGDFERRVVNGAVVLRWDLGEGDGMAVARMSSAEIKGGETIGAQLDDMLRYCDRVGRKPRIVVAVLNLSGRVHFDDRHDFGEIFESFARGEISWVVYKDVDRIARAIVWTSLLVYWLTEYGIRLHVAQLNRELDLNNSHDLLQLWMLALGAEMEAAKIAERTLTGQSTQLRQAGKGWGASGGFGFTRDDHRFIIVDEEEWPYVLLIHELYASLQSYKSVRRALEHDHGLRLSQGTISKILHDKRYLTGEIRTKDPDADEGFRVDFVSLSRPVPERLWEHNQMLTQARRGKRTQTPEAQFVTRGVPVYHARCMDTENPRRSTSQLRSVHARSGTYRLFHYSGPGAPTEGYRVPDCCRGWSIDVEVVERAVIRGVRTILEGNDALHAAIALGRANREPTAEGALFTADDRARLNREVKRLQRYRDSLWERHLDRIRKGRRPDREFLDEETQVVDAELAALQRQLTLDTQLRSRPIHPTQLPARIADVLTDDPPDDPSERLRRWAIVHELVSHVVVHDSDDGLGVELFGPLVPESNDPGTWDPLTACTALEDKADARPGVPEPFRNRSISERLVPAYRWRSGRLGAFATLDKTPELFVAAVRAASAIFPDGPVYAQRGLGHARWTSVARSRGLPIAMERSLAAAGTTPTALIRHTLGLEAITQGRVRRIQSRDEAVWVIATAILEGFSFEPGWTVRIQTCNQGKRYPFSYVRITDWANRFAGGNRLCLIEEAQRRAAELRRNSSALTHDDKSNG
jgi:DNA invertase Pin-like site-specific DNA recombinase